MRTGLTVAFVNNQIDNRGTGNALYDYAHYNEEYLGNKSIIHTFDTAPRHAGMEKRLLDRFQYIYSHPLLPANVDTVYHIKSGYDDGVRPTKGVRYAVHSVFDNYPHGDRYAFVSDWLADRNSGLAVPHIVDLPRHSETFRGDLGLPEDAIVFGRHGGSDSFDLSFVWDAISEAVLIDTRLHFVFLNTDRPNIKLHENIHFMESVADPYLKTKFINTCDAMIHGRGRGETFGIAVGEFDILGKPVLTYGNSPEQAHLETLVNPLTYEDRHGLLVQFVTAESWIHDPIESGYKIYDPLSVMKRFYEVFLSP